MGSSVTYYYGFVFKFVFFISVLMIAMFCGLIVTVLIEFPMGALHKNLINYMKNKSKNKSKHKSNTSIKILEESVML